MTTEVVDPFTIFDEACSEYNIVLDPIVYGSNHAIRDTDCLYCPTPLHVAIAAAARVVRKQFQIELASEPIPNDLQAPDPIGIGTLRQLINATVEGTDATALPITSAVLERKYALGIDACPYAERYFGRTIDDIMDSKAPQTADKPHGYEVFADRRQDPLFLRKASGVSSALGLRPVTLNGITYPAGAIFRIDAKHDLYDGLGQVIPPKAALRRSTQDITEASFIRLSAFSYPPDQWTEFRAEEVDWNDSEQGSTLRALDSARVEAVRRKLAALLPELPDGLKHREA